MTRPAGTVSLDRALSKLGLASRTDAARLIRAGRVTVNGRVEDDPGRAVNPDRVRIGIDGRPQARVSPMTVMLHKPRGVITSTSDPDGRPTVMDLVRDVPVRVVPVGRLDVATSGLLLLTSDTRLGQWLTDPAHAIPRTYLVTVRGELPDAAADVLRGGVIDEGERLAPEAVVVRKRSARETHLTVVLTEGRNREVRRLFAAVGHDVTRLKRVAFGGLSLEALPVGQWRVVDDAELAAVFPGADRRSAGPRSARS